MTLSMAPTRQVHVNAKEWMYRHEKQLKQLTAEVWRRCSTLSEGTTLD